jgi:TolB-like protein
LPGPDIFLSYNREDQAVAKCFAEAFEVAGQSVWWDVTLRSGEAFDRVTEEALQTAKAVVVLWSPRSVDSRWVRAEASIADENGTLVPAKIEACQLPVMFRLTQTADLSNWRGEPGDPAWQAFLGDVRRMAAQGKREAESTSIEPPATTHRSGGIPLAAVLPIQCRGGDQEMQFFAEELAEDITRELSQSYYCKVIPASTMAAWRNRTADHRALHRELGARYAIEGNCHGAGGEIRLTVQLIDTDSDSMLWSARFVRKLSDIEASPEQFALSVAIELDQTIGRTEVAKAQAKEPPCSAWEHVLRSFGFSGIDAPGGARRAVNEARDAVAAAPSFGTAHAVLANMLTAHLQVDRRTVGDDERLTTIREARDAIKRAMELDSNNAMVLTRLAHAYCGLGDAEAGLRLAQRAATLAPNSAEAIYAVGFANFILGRPVEAIEAFSRQERIGLSDSYRLGGQCLLGICLFIEEKTTEAEAALDRALTLQPNHYLSLRWKAIIAAELGKEYSANAAIRLLLASEPGKSIDDYLDSPKHLPIDHPRKYEAIEILRRLLEETKKGV